MGRYLKVDFVKFVILNYLSLVFSNLITVFHLCRLAVNLVKDEARKKSKGFAFIQYASQEEALLAIESMDYKVLYACLVLLLPSTANKS